MRTTTKTHGTARAGFGAALVMLALAATAGGAGAQTVHATEVQTVHVTGAKMVHVTATVRATRSQNMMAAYDRAARFLGWNAEELVSHDRVRPHWYDGDHFWYRDHLASGWDYLTVDPATGTQAPLFDTARLGEALSLAADTAYDGRKLPIRRLRVLQNGRSVLVTVDSAHIYTCDVVAYTCRATPDSTAVPANEVRSPDGKWVAYEKDDNLWVRNLATGQAKALSHDGQPRWQYAISGLAMGCCEQVTRVVRHIKARPTLVWSPDSRRIATLKFDVRHVKDMYLLQTHKGRAILHAYPYALPGDSVVPTYDIYIFDVNTGRGVRVQRPPQVASNTSCCWLVSDTTWKDVHWSHDSRTLYFTYGERDFKKLRLEAANATTGAARTILADSSRTFVEENLASGGLPDWRVVDGGHRVIWFSERDGWGHLYLFDAASGRLLNRITSGPWTVGSIEHVDETAQWIYFTARGRERGRDPYERYLYRVHFDGSGLQLLTPQNDDHLVSMSPDGRYFVDTYSYFTRPAVSVLRAANGRVIRTLQKEDISRLRALGWPMPHPFRVKGRDGVTDVYGELFFPSNYDPARKYPVVDYIYPGPQTGPIGSRSFTVSPHGDAQAMAELGFIVFEIDAMGTPFRSKAFHDTYYGNMHDNGLPDHVAALRELAAHNPSMDLNRVGIVGHSGGGFSSTDAMLSYPDFYKVAVSGAGNHDNRGYDYTWGEKYQGLLVKRKDGTDNFSSQANQNYAKRLKGKLLIIYGTMDDNVNPNNSLMLINALIKANKNFNTLVLPNRNHGFGEEPYVIRKRWDYLVENLLHATPPPDFRIAPRPASPF